MSRLVEILSDALAVRSSRKGFVRTLAKIALASGAGLAGAGLTSALAANCCSPACTYGPHGNTCPPWNCEGQAFCCRAPEGYYGCIPCNYCGTGQTICYVTYYGPGPECPSVPAH